MHCNDPMQVYLTCIGDLQAYFGREPHRIELPADASIAALYLAIDERWGKGLPPYLWDPERRRFKGPVYLIIDGKIVSDVSTPLQDGAQVKLMKALAGG